MTLLSFKALHIIAAVAWFAGLFYLARLFVYHSEAFLKEENAKGILTDQYKIMEGRVYKIIMNPAMVLTLIGGVGMLIASDSYLMQTWMHIKLTLILGLLGYHFWCRRIMKTLANGQMPMQPLAFRFFNEVPTLFLVAIVSLAVLRDGIAPVKLLLILVGLIAFLVMATLAYKRYRQR